MSEQDPKPSLPYGWIVRQSRTYPECVYFFNTKTGHKSWDPPTLQPPKQEQVLTQQQPENRNQTHPSQQLAPNAGYMGVPSSRPELSPDWARVSSSTPEAGVDWTGVYGNRPEPYHDRARMSGRAPAPLPHNDWAIEEARFSPNATESGPGSPSACSDDSLDLNYGIPVNQSKRVTFGQSSFSEASPVSPLKPVNRVHCSQEEQKRVSPILAPVASVAPRYLPVTPNKAQIEKLIWSSRNQPLAQEGKPGVKSRLGFGIPPRNSKQPFSNNNGGPGQRSIQTYSDLESGHINDPSMHRPSGAIRLRQKYEDDNPSIQELDDVEVESSFGIPLGAACNKRKVINSGSVTTKKLRLSENSNSNSSWLTGNDSESNVGQGKGRASGAVFSPTKRKVITSEATSEKTTVERTVVAKSPPAGKNLGEVPVIHVSGVKRKSSDFSAGITKLPGDTTPKYDTAKKVKMDNAVTPVSPVQVSGGSQHSEASSQRKVIRIKRIALPADATPKSDDAVQMGRQRTSPSASMPRGSSLTCSMPVSSLTSTSNELDTESSCRGNLKDPSKIASIQSWLDKIVEASSLSPETTHSGTSSGSIASDSDKFKVPIETMPPTLCQENAQADTPIRPLKDLSDSGYSTSTFSTALQTPTPMRPTEDVRDVVQMDVDEEVQIKGDLQEVRECIKANPDQLFGKLTENVSTGTFMDVDVSVSNVKKENQALFVVLDTNTLMNHLGFIEEFRDSNIEGLGRPTLVIPWMVLQELDALKNKQQAFTKLTWSTQAKAKAPVHFLYSCFASKHPRIIGQNPGESKEDFKELDLQCNDDRVLQCCLQWKQKHPSSHVVLCTDDINLCNKALVSKVTALTKEKLISGLQSIAEENGYGQCDNLVYQESSIPPQPCEPKSTNQNVRQVEITPDKATTQQKQETELQLADDIVCEMKQTMKSVLRIVLEREMKEAYDSVWTEIVFRKPPWSLKELLECYQKHWIAVFGMVFQRQNQSHFTTLLDHFKQGKGYGTNIRQACCLLDSCIVILKDLATVKDSAKKLKYTVTLKDTLRIIEALQALCQDVIKGTKRPSDVADLQLFLGLRVSQPAEPIVPTREVTLPSPVESLSSQPVPSTEFEDMSAGVSTDTLDQDEDEALAVGAKFQRNWEAINQFVEDMKYKVSNGLDEEVIARIKQDLPILKSLRREFNRALSVKRREIPGKKECFYSLSATLNHPSFTEPNNADKKTVGPEQLQRFFSKKSNRIMLQIGLMQLDEMLKSLYHCVKQS